MTLYWMKNRIVPGLIDVLLLSMTLFMFDACSHTAPSPAPLDSGSPSIAEAITKEAEPREPIDIIQEAYQNFMFAAVAMNRGDIEAAEKFLSLAVENDPDSLFLRSKMAQILKGLKQYREAVIHALKCVELDPENIKYRILLADLYALMGRDDLANEQYDKALQIDPDNKRIRLLVITLLVKQDQLSTALENLDELIAQSPEMVIAHYYRGKVFMKMEQYQKAEESFQEVLRLSDDRESAMLELGALYQTMGRDMDAVEIYERLLDSYPENVSVRIRLIDLYDRLNQEKNVERHLDEMKALFKPGDPKRQALGLIYLKQGRLDEAVEELNRTARAFPDNDKTIYYLAVAYEEKEDHQKALEHFRLIGQNSTYFNDAQLHMAYILSAQNKYDEAVAVIENALSISGEEARLYLMLSSLHEDQEDLNAAIQVIEDGIRQIDDHIELIFRLGVLLDKRGDKALCLEQMKKVLEIDPDHADALNYIGYTYAEEGIRLDEALEMIQKALDLKPDSGYIIDSLGWIYYKKGLYEEAVTYLEKSEKLTPDDPTINEHLGDAYFMIKAYKKALNYYKRALTLNHPDQKALEQKINEVEHRLEQRD